MKDVIEILKEAGYSEVIPTSWQQRDADARATGIGTGERVTPWFDPADRDRIISEHGPLREGMVIGVVGADDVLVLWSGDLVPTQKKRRLVERITPDIRRAPTDDGGAVVRVEPLDAENMRAVYPDGACNSVVARMAVVSWPPATMAEWDKEIEAAERRRAEASAV